MCDIRKRDGGECWVCSTPGAKFPVGVTKIPCGWQHAATRRKAYWCAYGYVLYENEVPLGRTDGPDRCCAIIEAFLTEDAVPRFRGRCPTGMLLGGLENRCWGEVGHGGPCTCPGEPPWCDVAERARLVALFDARAA